MAEKVNLQKSYSALNEKLAKTFDESGVSRSFTVPYIDGQQMDEHVAAVGQAAAQSGGLTNNLLTTMHHSDGKGWGSGDGHTIGHPSDALRTTLIPDDDKNAIETIQAAQKHLDNIGSLIGDDDPAVKMAKSQLNLVKKTDGAGMNLLDFGVMLTQIMYGPNQAIARAHQAYEHGQAFARPKPATIPHTPATPADDQPTEPAGGNAVAEAWPLRAHVQASPLAYSELSATHQDAQSFLSGGAKDNQDSDGR